MTAVNASGYSAVKVNASGYAVAVACTQCGRAMLAHWGCIDGRSFFECQSCRSFASGASVEASQIDAEQASESSPK